MKIFGTIRPIETRDIEIEAESYEQGLALMKAEVPAGWQLLKVTTQQS